MSIIRSSDEKDLKCKMRRFRIFLKDIKESFVRSSGPGGQNVNKVSTCVMLHHIPTGIKVKCQSERTQVLNRHKARCLLVEKIEKKQKQSALQEQQIAQKKKRQNRRKPKALKESILKDKKYQSDKKSRRKKVNFNKLDEY